MMPGVTKERDPNLMALERSIFSSLKEISEQDDREKNIPKTDQKWIGSLSVEDAIKELLDMHKQNKI